MKNILITWTSSGIWAYLKSSLWEKHHIFWVSRNWNDDFVWDLRDISFLQEISKKVETLDFLIINAWVWYFDRFENISLEEHKQIIETNLLSPILLSNLLLKENKIKSGIIFIWSVAGKKSSKFGASYSASKWGLRGFAMQIKNEFPKLQIHLLNPKIVKTDFHKNSRVEIVWKYKETKIEDIKQNIENIFLKKEKKFEIDL